MKRIFLSPPDVGPTERALMLEAFDSNWLAPLGPHVEAFEKEFAAHIDMPHAVALSSGTAALHLALLGLGIGPGDDVITSTLTFAATANAIRYVGANPVFLDVSPDSWTLDPGLLEEEFKARSAAGRRQVKAVVSVDLYGQACDYDPIERLCREHGVLLVEDAAEALGAMYRDRHAGAFGACAAFSFNGNKIITTSGGGMLVSHRPELIARARHLATQARDAAPHYQHSDVGYNYRLSNLLAAIGRGQLRGLDAKIQRRRAIRDHYKHALAVDGLSFMPEASYGTTNAWLSCVLIEPARFGAGREDVRLRLEAGNIEARPLWKPMHMQPVFRHALTRGGAVSERLFELGLCLPSGSSLTDDELERVQSLILSAGKRTIERATRATNP